MVPKLIINISIGVYWFWSSQARWLQRKLKRKSSDGHNNIEATSDTIKLKLWLIIFSKKKRNPWCGFSIFFWTDSSDDS